MSQLQSGVHRILQWIEQQPGKLDPKLGLLLTPPFTPSVGPNTRDQIVEPASAEQMQLPDPMIEPINFDFAEEISEITMPNFPAASAANSDYASPASDVEHKEFLADTTRDRTFEEMSPTTLACTNYS
jgi:hypothetical protein